MYNSILNHRFFSYIDDVCSISNRHTGTMHIDMLTLKTLFNIVEAPLLLFFNIYFDVCVAWWCSDGPVNSQEYKSFEIYAVSIKISMTEYHHWINDLVDHLFYNTAVYGEKWVWYFWSLAYFRFFEALNGAFEVQFFSGLQFYTLSKTLMACRDM